MEALPRHGELTDWRVVRSLGDAGAFHASVPDSVRSATFHTVEHPTYVLGSAQDESTVDTRVAVALGAEVVRRRSGGGGVLLVPGEYVWLDLVIPAGDPLWSDDVAAAMRWAGAVWSAALATGGVAVELHAGPMVRSPWSPVVCFAGLGTGELTLPGGGAKVVGISQRRTKDWARVQTMCHLRWRPEWVAALMCAPRPAVSEVARWAAPVAMTAAQLEAALIAQLPA